MIYDLQEYWSQPARQIVRRYRQRQQQQQQQALAAASSDVGNGSLVLARSLHECGYPDCGKIFRHKQHLLRHQTQKHGRTPTRMLGLQKVWLRPGDMDQDGGQQNFNTSGTVSYSDTFHLTFHLHTGVIIEPTVAIALVLFDILLSASINL